MALVGQGNADGADFSGGLEGFEFVEPIAFKSPVGPVDMELEEVYVSAPRIRRESSAWRVMWPRGKQASMPTRGEPQAMIGPMCSALVAMKGRAPFQERRASATISSASRSGGRWRGS